jgi:hypothetical protein
MSIILSNTGQWVTVQPPKGHDPSWQASDLMRYATIFQSAVEKGFDISKAVLVAEAIVNRNLYPGLVYHDKLEQDIEWLGFKKSTQF